MELAALAVILVAYSGAVRLPLPGGAPGVLVGAALAWATGLGKIDPAAWQGISRSLRTPGRCGCLPPEWAQIPSE
jgi:hypothetical protein